MDRENKEGTDKIVAPVLLSTNDLQGLSHFTHKHLLRQELLSHPFYRWRNRGLEVKIYAQHPKSERGLNPRQLASRNHRFGQVTTLLHSKVRTLGDL